MIQRLETKACRSCSAAKRKCTRHLPQCARCRKQGISCQYPPSKPSCFILLDTDEEAPTENQLAIRSTATSTLPSCVSLLESDNAGLPHHGAVSFCFGTLPDSTLYASNWFSGPSTWKIIEWPMTPQLWSPGATHIKRLLAIIYQWYTQWLHKASNPFIHNSFYRHRFPRCAQDAYSTLSAYLHRTASNTPMLLQLVDSRATQLLAENGVYRADQQASEDGLYLREPRSVEKLDTHEHIARIHALTLYQLLALYSPSATLRRRAEDRIDILVDWMDALLEHAQQAIPLVTETLFDHSSSADQPDPTCSSDKLWHAWILAESTRRAFMIGTTVQALYLMLREGATSAAAARNHITPGGCKGGMPFTTRRGAWEASNSTQWEQLAVEVDFGLTYIDEARDLFTKVGDREEWEVDVFAKAYIQGTFGGAFMQKI